MAAMAFPEREVRIPPLRVVVQYRRIAGDSGPSVQIYAPVGEQERQVLRIDCFAELPHYHLDPADRDRVRLLHLRGHQAAIEWALTQLRERLPDLLREAGFPQVADQLSPEAIAQGLPSLSQALHEVLTEGTRPL